MENTRRAVLEAAERWVPANDLAVVRARSNLVRSNAHLFYERRGCSVEKMSQAFIKSRNEPESDAQP